MIFLINAVPMATVLKEISNSYRPVLIHRIHLSERTKNERKNERKILRSRFRSFFVRFSERNGIYFLAIVYNRVPFSSVVISSNSGSIAFTKASNHVWYASAINLGSTPAVRQ